MAKQSEAPERESQEAKPWRLVSTDKPVGKLIYHFKCPAWPACQKTWTAASEISNCPACGTPGYLGVVIDDGVLVGLGEALFDPLQMLVSIAEDEHKSPIDAIEHAAKLSLNEDVTFTLVLDEEELEQLKFRADMCDLAPGLLVENVIAEYLENPDAHRPKLSREDRGLLNSVGVKAWR